MRLRPWTSWARFFFFLFVISGFCSEHAFSQAEEAAPGETPGEGALYLKVFINGVSTELIAEFRRRSDNSFAIAPEELRQVGLLPAAAALDSDGLVALDRLPGVAFAYDEAAQQINFTVGGDEARAPHSVEVGSTEESALPLPRADLGALMNYTLFASSGGQGLTDLVAFEGMSGALGARIFGAFGTVAGTAFASTTSDDPLAATRLDTTWTYSNPKHLLTGRAGDIISGGLTWTRPVRLGGVQMQRDFHLRPDLVTLPLPSFSGSAAVPSTLDIFVDNGMVYSGGIPAGPFVAEDLPVVSGAGTARVVLTDALGRETVRDIPFYASSDLLRPGLLDFSAEAGLPRLSYGLESFDYSPDWFASGSLRYGLLDWLTLEGHAEGGERLLNGGAGSAFTLGRWGVGSLSLAGSVADAEIGTQVTGSMDIDWRGLSLFAQAQHTFGDYRDVAAVTAHEPIVDSLPPQALEQLSVGFPMPFDPGAVSVGATHALHADGDEDWLATASYSRPLPRRSSFYATAFVDLAGEADLGGYVGFSMPLGDNVSLNSGARFSAGARSASVNASRSEKPVPGSVGWRVQASQDGDQAAGASYRTTFARAEASVVRSADSVRADAQIEGALVVAGGGIFATNRIDDAFAVVDVGAPDVEVLYENRPVGKTGRSGRLLLPDLRSYEANKVAIDPKNLPVDAVVSSTENVIVPADRSGVSVDFGVSVDVASALVEFHDANGEPIEAGSSGNLVDGTEGFFVGYDGQAFVTGLGPHNTASITRTDGTICNAQFDFTPDNGVQVQVPAVACLPQPAGG